MKRKIYETLVEWKNRDARRTALLIDGARRVGKSFIAEEFARNEYNSYCLIDFSKPLKKIRELFELYLDDLDSFFLYLQQRMNVRLVPGRSLVIFDEVQLFPPARGFARSVPQSRDSEHSASARVDAVATATSAGWTKERFFRRRRSSAPMASQTWSS